MEDKQNKKAKKKEQKFCLRLEYDTFLKMDNKVHNIKIQIDDRKYSINKYITELIENDLKEGNSNE